MDKIDNCFESILLEAVLRCEGNIFLNQKNRNGFSDIYPFTTENINGYMSNFELRDTSLMTIGSSLDQVINALLLGCRDITVVDICPFTKFYFYLKKSAILNLDYEDFFKFFCYKDYPKVFIDNKEVFNLEIFKTLKPTLRLLDYESYLFWDELFTVYSPIKIRHRLFNMDEYRKDFLKELNLYLCNEDYYYKTKDIIMKINPNFIIDDIFNINLDQYFDNIWLSNLGKYLSLNKLKELIDKLKNNLNDNGKLLVSYLYETTYDTPYLEYFEEIYNLDKVFKIFKEDELELINFKGINDIKFHINEENDSILLYKKKTKVNNLK